MTVSEMFDQEKSTRFSERLVAMMNHAALTLMVSLGHRTGLFDSLKDQPPSTSAAVAGRAGLDERYVREWLGAMVTGNIMEYDPAAETYCLPPEHAAWLTRGSPEGNIAVFAQYIPQLGSVEDEVLHCFKNGGGVPYASFKRFHEIMEEDSGQSIVPVIVDQVIPLMPGMREALDRGVEALDVGCGRGRALQELARAFPQSRFTGLDLSPEAIEHANRQAKEKGLTNITFQVQNVAELKEQERYFLILALDAIHDQADPARVLANIHRALDPAGSLMMQDISGSTHVHKNREHPIGSLLYTISCMHCMTVSLAQGGAGLGAMWGIEKAQTMLMEAGFSRVVVHRLEHDFQNCYFVARKGDL